MDGVFLGLAGLVLCIVAEINERERESGRFTVFNRPGVAEAVLQTPP